MVQLSTHQGYDDTRSAISSSSGDDSHLAERTTLGGGCVIAHPWLISWLADITQRLPAFKAQMAKLLPPGALPQQGITIEALNSLVRDLPHAEQMRFHKLMEVSIRQAAGLSLPTDYDMAQHAASMQHMKPEPVQQQAQETAAGPAYVFFLALFDKQVAATITIQRAWRAYAERCKRYGKPPEPAAMVLRRKKAQLRATIEAHAKYMDQLKKQGKLPDRDTMVRQMALKQEADELLDPDDPGHAALNKSLRGVRAANTPTATVSSVTLPATLSSGGGGSKPTSQDNDFAWGRRTSQGGEGGHRGSWAGDDADRSMRSPRRSALTSQRSEGAIMRYMREGASDGGAAGGEGQSNRSSRKGTPAESSVRAARLASLGLSPLPPDSPPGSAYAPSPPSSVTSLTNIQQGPSGAWITGDGSRSGAPSRGLDAVGLEPSSTDQLTIPPGLAAAYWSNGSAGSASQAGPSLSSFDPADKMRYTLADMMGDTRLHGLVRTAGGGSSGGGGGSSSEPLSAQAALVRQQADQLFRDMMLNKTKGGGMEMIEKILLANGKEEAAQAIRDEVTRMLETGSFKSRLAKAASQKLSAEASEEVAEAPQRMADAQAEFPLIAFGPREAAQQQQGGQQLQQQGSPFGRPSFQVQPMQMGLGQQELEQESGDFNPFHRPSVIKMKRVSVSNGPAQQQQEATEFNPFHRPSVVKMQRISNSLNQQQQEQEQDLNPFGRLSMQVPMMQGGLQQQQDEGGFNPFLRSSTAIARNEEGFFQLGSNSMRPDEGPTDEFGLRSLARPASVGPQVSGGHAMGASPIMGGSLLDSFAALTTAAAAPADGGPDYYDIDALLAEEADCLDRRFTVDDPSNRSTSARAAAAAEASASAIAAAAAAAAAAGGSGKAGHGLIAAASTDADVHMTLHGPFAAVDRHRRKMQQQQQSGDGSVAGSAPMISLLSARGASATGRSSSSGAAAPLMISRSMHQLQAPGPGSDNGAVAAAGASPSRASTSIPRSAWSWKQRGPISDPAAGCTPQQPQQPPGSDLGNSLEYDDDEDGPSASAVPITPSGPSQTSRPFLRIDVQEDRSGRGPPSYGSAGIPTAVASPLLARMMAGRGPSSSGCEPGMEGARDSPASGTGGAQAVWADRSGRGSPAAPAAASPRAVPVAAGPRSSYSGSETGAPVSQSPRTRRLAASASMQGGSGTGTGLQSCKSATMVWSPASPGPLSGGGGAPASPGLSRLNSVDAAGADAAAAVAAGLLSPPSPSARTLVPHPPRQPLSARRSGSISGLMSPLPPPQQQPLLDGLSLPSPGAGPGSGSFRKQSCREGDQAKPQLLRASASARSVSSSQVPELLPGADGSIVFDTSPDLQQRPQTSFGEYMTRVRASRNGGIQTEGSLLDTSAPWAIAPPGTPGGAPGSTAGSMLMDGDGELMGSFAMDGRSASDKGASPLLAGSAASRAATPPRNNSARRAGQASPRPVEPPSLAHSLSASHLELGPVARDIVATLSASPHQQQQQQPSLLHSASAGRSGRAPLKVSFSGVERGMPSPRTPPSPSLQSDIVNLPSPSTRPRVSASGGGSLTSPSALAAAAAAPATDGGSPSLQGRRPQETFTVARSPSMSGSGRDILLAAESSMGIAGASRPPSRGLVASPFKPAAAESLTRR